MLVLIVDEYLALSREGGGAFGSMVLELGHSTMSPVLASIAAAVPSWSVVIRKDDA